MPERSFVDSDVPVADDLNVASNRSVSHYANAAAVAAEFDRPPDGKVVFVEDVAQVWVGAGGTWRVAVEVFERKNRVYSLTPLRTPHTADWRSRSVAAISAANRARRAGFAGVGGQAGVELQPRDVRNLSGADAATWSGVTVGGAYAAGYEGNRELAYIPIPEPTGGAATPPAFTLLPDEEYVSLVLVGVGSLLVPKDWGECLVVAVGAGGYGGAAGSAQVGTAGVSPIGGGGGGAGGLHETEARLRAGQVLRWRCGIHAPLTDFPAERLDTQNDEVFADGFRPDITAMGSAAWVDGRPLAHAGGGSRGGTHIAVPNGGEPSPLAYLLGGASQGGSAGLSTHVTEFPAPAGLGGGLANRGGTGGSAAGSATSRVLSSGGGGGGAEGRGEQGETITYTTDLGVIALGGEAGAGIDYGWAGVGTLARGGDGGWAAGYPAGLPVDSQEEGTAGWGSGGAGASAHLSTLGRGDTSGGHLRSEHRPGQGCVIVRIKL